MELRVVHTQFLQVRKRIGDSVHYFWNVGRFDHNRNPRLALLADAVRVESRRARIVDEHTEVNPGPQLCGEVHNLLGGMGHDVERTKLTGAERTARKRRRRGVRVEREVRRHCGADGTSPYRLMTATSAALSGGPPAFATAATSLKYWAPMSGDRMISARATLSNGLEKA